MITDFQINQALNTPFNSEYTLAQLVRGGTMAVGHPKTDVVRALLKALNVHEFSPASRLRSKPLRDVGNLPCDMGMECDTVGVCYADAHGQPERCPKRVAHDLYKTGDADAPDSIKDSNGEVTLGLCRKCGKGEGDLVEPCVAPGAASKLAAEVTTILTEAERMGYTVDTSIPLDTLRAIIFHLTPPTAPRLHPYQKRTVDLIRAAGRVGMCYVDTKRPAPRCSAPHCKGHTQFEYDCIDCTDALQSALAAPPTVDKAWLPDEGAYIVRFDDASMEDAFFACAGAKEAALAYYEKVSQNWNAHLFVKIDSNSRACDVPSATPPAVDKAWLRDVQRCLYDVATEMRAKGRSDSRFIQLIARAPALKESEA